MDVQPTYISRQTSLFNPSTHLISNPPNPISSPTATMPRKTGTTKPHDSGHLYHTTWSSPHSDLSQVTDAERAERNKASAELNEAYYDFITDHYQGGWGDKFHFCGYQPGESWEAAQARHEHHLALMTDIKPGMEVLDLGCGVGGPAREMAIFTGCRVTGVTINGLQVERGNQYNAEAGLADQVHMVQGNFIDLPFADSSFDRAYSTEALCCAPDVGKAYSEVYRVLKPDGKLGFLDWVITDKYDDGNPQHRRIRSEIEKGSAVPFLTTKEVHLKNLKEAGFRVVVEEDRAVDKSNPVPWW
jgi:sterol 24-C-methyltransferase